MAAAGGMVGLVLEYRALAAIGRRLDQRCLRRDQIVSALRELVGTKQTARLLGIWWPFVYIHLNRLDEF